MNNQRILASLFLLIALKVTGQEVATVYEYVETTLEWDYKDRNAYYFSLLPYDIQDKVEKFLRYNWLSKYPQHDVEICQAEGIYKKRLLSFLAKFYHLLPKGWWIFSEAFKNGEINAIKAYIANANIYNMSGNLPLEMSIEHNQIEAVRLLLNAGMDPNHEGKPGFPCDLFPLQIAAKSGHAQICHLLIHAGAQVDITNGRNLTPLGIAAAQGHEEVVQLFLESGAEINKVLGWKWSALSLAAHGQHWNMVKFLVSKGADVNMGDERTGYPLKYAIRAGDEEMITFLLNAGARKDVKVYDGWCTSKLEDNFHTYCPKGKYEAVKKILDRY